MTENEKRNTSIKNTQHIVADVLFYAPVEFIFSRTQNIKTKLISKSEELESSGNFAKAIGQFSLSTAKNRFSHKISDFTNSLVSEKEEDTNSQVVDNFTVNTNAGDQKAKAEILNRENSLAPDEMASTTPSKQEDTSLPGEVFLPIRGYTTLAATQIIEKLGSLTPGELDEIYAYEVVNRKRRTILTKIIQLKNAGNHA
jgi:hypothetical protein